MKAVKPNDEDMMEDDFFMSEEDRDWITLGQFFPGHMQDKINRYTD